MTHLPPFAPSATPPPDGDKNFFYEATQKLCSSLQPEPSIAAFYEYVTRFVPLRGFLLTSTPIPLNSILIVASATRNGVECPFRRIALLPEQLLLSAKLDLNNPAQFHEYIFTDATSPHDELARFLSFPHPWQMRRPVYLLRLVRENHIIGSAFFAGLTLFSDRRLHLLRGLEGPLCLALSNMLQHRELQQRQQEILQDNQRLRRQLAKLARLDVIGADRGLAGTFREDLFYRLNVVNIHLPPLRERREDIPLLIRHMLRHSAAAFSMTPPAFAPGEMERLLAYDWPGNVRELRNVLEEALVCCGRGALHFPPGRLASSPASSAAPDSHGEAAADFHASGTMPAAVRVASGHPQDYAALSRDYFVRLLEDSHWRVAGKNGAAAKTGLKPGTFRFKCQKLGIELRPGDTPTDRTVPAPEPS